MEINNKFINFEIIDIQQFTDIDQKRKPRLDRDWGSRLRLEREGERGREGGGKEERNASSRVPQMFSLKLVITGSHALNNQTLRYS